MLLKLGTYVGGHQNLLSLRVYVEDKKLTAKTGQEDPFHRLFFFFLLKEK